MNWDIIKSKWKYAGGALKTKWGQLTDDDITIVDGQRVKLISKIQARYGIAREEAEKEVRDFERDYRDIPTYPERRAHSRA